ncbi:hypothetical protein Tco_0821307 [Tanacetum coccineum]|uniref:Uncharacterized protein n=1 Tax=Tanacetum coccineum TaxID=301880 RepID=A0ABQ5AG79_9ASTR
MLNMNVRVYNQQSQSASVTHQVIHPQSSQASNVSQQSPVDLLQFDSEIVVPYFLPTDDPFECSHKALAFMCTTLASIFPSTNNQLETSSNLMNQVDMQGRQTHSYVGNFSKSNDHIARQCTQPMKVHNSAWFKEKMLPAQVQNARIALSKEQLAILADIGDKVNSGPYVISEVPTYNTYHDNHVFEQNVQEMQDCKQQAFVDDSNDEFTSESNMISYEQYLKENKSQVVHNTLSPANQDSMIMFVIEQMSNQVAKCNAEYKENQVINESLTAELERYKERIKTFEQRLNIDLNSHEKLIVSQMDDMIREILALNQQIDSLKLNLSNQIKEKE